MVSLIEPVLWKRIPGGCAPMTIAGIRSNVGGGVVGVNDCDSYLARQEGEKPDNDMKE
jgi:hypothetical protein